MLHCFIGVVQIEALLLKESHWTEKLSATVHQVSFYSYSLCANVFTLLWEPIKHCISLSGLQRMPSTSQTVETEKNQASTQQSLKAGDLSAWALEQDPSESLHAEPLERHEYDYSCEEQMVPASMAYQPYRYDSRYPGLAQIQGDLQYRKK